MNTTTINAVAEAIMGTLFHTHGFASSQPMTEAALAAIEAYEKANLTTTSMSESGVDAVAEAMANIFVNSTKDALVPMTATEAVVRINKHKLAQTAIEAYEKSSVKEMTENELANLIADEIYENEDREVAFTTIALCQRIAWKLAKLGTIRIVGGGE